MTTTDLVPASDSVQIDGLAVLRTLGLDPADPKAQALVLVARTYGLDPVLRHLVLVDGKPYVTRDGLLHVAHRSGELDGIEVLEQGDTDSHWTARVAVYRKDMSRPFVYAGRYPKAGSNKRYGPEMALKVAEVMALRRAFPVTGIGVLEEAHDDHATRSESIAPDLAAEVARLDEMIAQLADGHPARGWWAQRRGEPIDGHDLEQLEASIVALAEGEGPTPSVSEQPS